MPLHLTLKLKRFMVAVAAVAVVVLDGIWILYSWLFDESLILADAKVLALPNDRAVVEWNNIEGTGDEC